MTINLNLIFVFFITTLLAVKTNAQTTEIKISFDEYITSSSLPGSGLDEASWGIFNDKGVEISSGNAKEIFNFKFEKHGDYYIRFVHEHKHNEHAATCNHYAMPNEVKVIVNSKKIIFHTEKISFSKKISADTPADGIIMFVPVTIIDQKNSIEIPMNRIAQSIGINTSVAGFLKLNQMKLNPGNHVLEYNLTGKATKGTYIGFDFIDLNGNITPFGILEPIL
jgi:hypothetical protein